MQILIADPDSGCRRRAHQALAVFSTDVVLVEDGLAAWRLLQTRTQPMVAVIERALPVIDGLELCRQARHLPPHPPLYLLVASRELSADEVAEGLDAGADDCVVKPFNAAELRARAQVGIRLAALQESMAQRLAELEDALANLKQLRGLLPMCAYCKKIRVDESYWQQLEAYLAEHSEAEFTHGVCPDCFPTALTGAPSDGR